MRGGLDRLFADVPAGSGYVDLSGGWSSLAGPFARAEAGQRFTEHLGAFGFGQWTQPEQTAGVGLRFTW